MVSSQVGKALHRTLLFLSLAAIGFAYLQWGPVGVVVLVCATCLLVVSSTAIMNETDRGKIAAQILLLSILALIGLVIVVFIGWFLMSLRSVAQGTGGLEFFALLFLIAIVAGALAPFTILVLCLLIRQRRLVREALTSIERAATYRPH